MADVGSFKVLLKTRKAISDAAVDTSSHGVCPQVNRPATESRKGECFSSTASKLPRRCTKNCLRL